MSENESEINLDSNTKIYDPERIEELKNLRQESQKKRSDLFQKMDIDQSTSIENRDLYKYALSDSESSFTDHYAPKNFENDQNLEKFGKNFENDQNLSKNDEFSNIFDRNNQNLDKKQYIEQNIDQNQFFSNNYRRFVGDLTNTNFDQSKKIETMEDLEKEIGFLKTEMKTNAENLDQKISEMQNNLKSLQEQEENIDLENDKIEKNYTFFQNFRNKIYALCYCLKDKIQIINELEEEIEFIREKKNELLNEYYFENKHSKQEIEEQFEIEMNKIYKKSTKIFEEIDPSIIDINSILNEIYFIKCNFFEIFIKNNFIQTIPEIITPLIKVHLANSPPEGWRIPSEKFCAILKQIEISEGENSAIPNFNLAQTVFEKCVGQKFKEIFKFEWDPFSRSCTKRFFDCFNNLMECISVLNFKPILKIILERFLDCFSKLKKLSDLSRHQIKFIKNLLHNYDSAYKTLLSMAQIYDESSLQILKLYKNKEKDEKEKNEEKNLENPEDRLIGVSIELRNLVKTLSSENDS